MLPATYQNSFISILLIACLPLSGCASTRADRELKKATEIRFFSEEEFIEGERIHQEMMGNFYTYTDPKVVGYVGEIGKSLTGDVPRGKKAYQFTIIYNDDIYATSAPGGFIYVTTGMINFLENESELAAVLAKEIGALQYKDPRLEHGDKFKNGAAYVVALISPFFGVFGMMAVVGVIAWDILTDPKEISAATRNLTADTKAMHYMVHAGYDPQGFIDVMYRFLEAEREIRPYFHDYFISHPITQERFEAVSESFKTLPMANRSFSVNRDKFLDMTKGVREMYKI